MTLAVTRVTPDVAARAAAFRGRVQSVHRAAAYLAIEDPPALFVVALDSVGGQPGGILVSGVGDIRDLGIRAGMPAVAGDSRIAIADAGIRLDLAGAPMWSATLPVFADVVSAEVLAQTLRLARGVARRGASGRGFAPLLVGRDAADDPFVRAARPHLAAIRRALDTGDAECLCEAAVSLIGLGVGLTPSGDDLLVGLMAGLFATANPLAPVVAAAVESAADERTTTIGAASLRRAADGEFAERLHDVVRAIGTGAGPDLDATVRRAAACGSTSGIDTLVGLFVALDGAVTAAAIAVAS